MRGYYDTLLTHSFGNYRQLMEAVTHHPWMGLYLSAMKNRKADPSKNRFQDENYAREVMQLFSIGLWLLNPDRSQLLSDGQAIDPDGETIPSGQPIPTYGQSQIAEIARVFTGMSYGTRFTTLTKPTEIPTTNFYDSNNVPWQPMRMFDGKHDLAPITVSFAALQEIVANFLQSIPTASRPPRGSNEEFARALTDPETMGGAAIPSTPPFKMARSSTVGAPPGSSIRNHLAR